MPDTENTENTEETGKIIYEPPRPKEKAPSLNRQLAMKILAAGIAATAVAGITLMNTGKKHKTAPEHTEAASDVKPPADLGRRTAPANAVSGGAAEQPQLYSGAAQYQDNPLASPNGQALPPPPQNHQTQAVAPPQNRQTQAAAPPPARYSGSPNEKSPAELARESPLVPEMQGSLFGSKQSQNYAPQQTVSSAQQYPAMPAGIQDSMNALSALSQNPLGNIGGLLSSGGSNYTAQNMQNDKQAFYKGASGADTAESGQALEPGTLFSGVVIPAVLITGINTDLPGDIQARVAENIYDSRSGKLLLIPQGTILIAKYNSSIAYAQSRVQIVWNTLIRPDGYLLEMGGMNGVDAQGYSGTKGIYSENLFQYLKAAGIISLFTALNAQMDNQITSASDTSLSAQMAMQNQAVVNQLSGKLIERALDIQPTIRVKSGTKVNVMLNKNLRLPPVADNPVSAKYVRD